MNKCIYYYQLYYINDADAGKCRMLEKCMGENRTREAYKLIKQLNRKWTSTQRMIKDKNGKIIQGREETKKRWTEYCSGLYSNNENNKELVDELERIAPIQNEEDTEVEDDILYEEVEKAENQLKQNKSTETDEITGEMIQAGRERMTEEINKLCWQAWREGKIPEEWTKTILVTIPKREILW